MLLGDHIGLVYRTLNDLLLLRVEILSQRLVELGLLLLQACSFVSNIQYLVCRIQRTQQGSLE